jgi:hypothetical protein
VSLAPKADLVTELAEFHARHGGGQGRGEAEQVVCNRVATRFLLLMFWKLFGQTFMCFSRRIFNTGFKLGFGLLFVGRFAYFLAKVPPSTTKHGWPTRQCSRSFLGVAYLKANPNR